MAVNLDAALVSLLAKRFPGAAAADRTGDGMIVFTVPAADIFAFLKVLRLEEPFSLDVLGDLTAVDYPDRLEMVYHLFSSVKNHRLAVRTALPRDAAALPSVTSLWPAADFTEREIYDLMGITFSGHPNLTRILLPNLFEGHPLRKDYQLPPRPATR